MTLLNTCWYSWCSLTHTSEAKVDPLTSGSMCSLNSFFSGLSSSAPLNRWNIVLVDPPLPIMNLQMFAANTFFESDFVHSCRLTYIHRFVPTQKLIWKAEGTHGWPTLRQVKLCSLPKWQHQEKMRQKQWPIQVLECYIFTTNSRANKTNVWIEWLNKFTSITDFLLHGMGPWLQPR